MLAIISTLILAAATPEVPRAQTLYEQALYDAALAALTPSCDKASDVVGCERVRGFVLVALGREADALAAFSRLLSADPNATFGSDVSPKLQAMFNDVKRSLRELGPLALEPVEEGGAGTWKLKLRLPRTAEVVRIFGYVMPSGREQFERVAFSAGGEIWVADYHPSGGASGPLRYYLEVVLRNKVTLAAGSAAMPKHVGLAFGQRAPLGAGAAAIGANGGSNGGSGGGSSDRGGGGDAASRGVDRPGERATERGGERTGSRAYDGTGASARTGGGGERSVGRDGVTPLGPFTPPVEDEQDDERPASPPLPKWAVWSIIGGAVGAVVIGVTATLLLSRKQEPGTVVVGISFQDDPL